MFVSQSKKGSAVYNGVILLTLVVIGVVIALSILKIKKDPKDPEVLRATLGLGKKKV